VSHLCVIGASAVSRACPVEGDDPVPPRMLSRMSRAAHLAAIAVRQVLGATRWDDARSEVGFFLGVGASGGALQEIESVLAESMEAGSLSMRALGERGLSACNPLFTFQTLHNFTLCQSAILEGLGGPNGAFYSRGAGTVTALEEALFALREGTCHRALAGGADSALHPLTASELVREGRRQQGLVPGEGAAVLALGLDAPRPLAVVRRVSIGALSTEAPLDDVPPSIREVVVTAWGEPPRQRIRRLLSERLPEAAVHDVSTRHGECLAASPALAWVAAIEVLARTGAPEVLVLSAGIDDQLGIVVLGAGGGT